MLLHFNTNIILATFDKSDLKIFLENKTCKENQIWRKETESNLLFTEVLFI